MSSQRPNIVFVFSDQQRYSALGANGNPVVRTPVLDGMAAEGWMEATGDPFDHGARGARGFVEAGQQLGGPGQVGAVGHELTRTSATCRDLPRPADRRRGS